MPTRSTGHNESVDGHPGGSAACSRRSSRSADPLGLLCALSVLVVALLLATTERSAQSAPVTPLAATIADNQATAPIAENRPEHELAGSAALSLVGWDTASLDYTIEFHRPRTQVRALTFPYERRIEVYVRPGDTVEGLAHVIAHEIGHAIDVEHNDPDERRTWLTSRGLSPEYPWWPGSGLNDFATGAGDFAECFAVWRMGDSSHSELPGQCDFELLERLVSDAS